MELTLLIAFFVGAGLAQLSMNASAQAQTDLKETQNPEHQALKTIFEAYLAGDRKSP